MYSDKNLREKWLKNYKDEILSNQERKEDEVYLFL